MYNQYPTVLRGVCPNCKHLFIVREMDDEEEDENEEAVDEDFRDFTCSKPFLPEVFANGVVYTQQSHSSQRSTCV